MSSDGSTPSTPPGGLLIEFIENFFAGSTGEVADSLLTRLPYFVRRKQEFLDLYTYQSLSPQLHALKSLEPGEIRPLVTHSLGDIANAPLLDPDALNRRLGFTREDEVTFQIQSLLLYADGVAIRDPFIASAGFVRAAKGGYALRLDNEISDSDFVNALKLICRLADLIRGQVVRFFVPPDLPIAGDLRSLALARIINKTARALASETLDQEDLLTRGALLTERALHQLACVSDPSVSTGTVFLPNLSDGAVLDVILDEVEELVVEAAALRAPEMAHIRNLANLLRLSLPGIPDIRLREVVQIRQDESFATFRGDVRGALLVADDFLKGDDLTSARTAVRDHMRGASERLKHRTRRGVLADTLAGDLVGWGAGVVVAQALAGWQAALATLFGKAVTEVLRDREKPAAKARAKHYLALSQAKTAWHNDTDPTGEPGSRDLSVRRQEARQSVLRLLGQE